MQLFCIFIQYNLWGSGFLKWLCHKNVSWYQNCATPNCIISANGKSYKGCSISYNPRTRQSYLVKSHKIFGSLIKLWESLKISIRYFSQCPCKTRISPSCLNIRNIKFLKISNIRMAVRSSINQKKLANLSTSFDEWIHLLSHQCRNKLCRVIYMNIY